MHKVVLQAPPGYSGEVHAGHQHSSQQNYTLDENGRVAMDHVDAHPLIAAGWIVVDHSERFEPHHRPDAARLADTGDGQMSQDHGDAIPPHGKPAEGKGSEAGRISADAEVEAQERAGMDPEHRSAHADTGGMDATKQAHADQSAAREN